MSVTDIAARYTPAVSWFYDTVAADVVLGAVSGVVSEVCAAVGEGGSVLDVGCGGGQLAQRLIHLHPGISVTGIDLSAEQIARATERSKALPRRHSERLHFQIASALDIPFAEEAFDAVVSIASIKHWPIAKGVSARWSESSRTAARCSSRRRTAAAVWTTRGDSPIAHVSQRRSVCRTSGCSARTSPDRVSTSTTPA